MSTQKYFKVPVGEMKDHILYVVSPSGDVVRKGDQLPPGTDVVWLPFDLLEGDSWPTTQEEALEMCDVS